MSQTTAELIVQEDQYYGQFEIKTYFYGEIRVKLFKDSQEILVLEFTDLEDIFTREKGFRKDARGIFRISRGECRARFGISQRIELRSKPLSIAPTIPQRDRGQTNNSSKFISQNHLNSSASGLDV